jgi:hypothetical protein
MLARNRLNALNRKALDFETAFYLKKSLDIKHDKIYFDKNINYRSTLWEPNKS